MPTDVYTRYKAQLEKIVSNPYPLVDTTGALLASEQLSTAWNAKRYQISDNLQNEQACRLKQQLGQAPFGWDLPMMT